MNACDYNPYTLPTIDFVGGETQDLAFHAFFHSKNKPFDLTGCTSNFSVIGFTNKIGDPIITKPMQILVSDDGDTNNILSVTIEPNETVNLSGKYIYQISIRSVEGIIEIPKQGILYITNNINKKFIRQ